MQRMPVEEAKEALNAISMWTDVPLANASRIQSPAWMLPVSLSKAEDLAVYKGDSRLTPEAVLTDDVESDSEQNVGAVFKALSASIKTSYASASSDVSSQSCTTGRSKIHPLCHVCNLNHSRRGSADAPICHGCDDYRAMFPRVNSDDQSMEKMLRDALWDVQTVLMESVGSDLDQRGLLPLGNLDHTTAQLVIIFHTFSNFITPCRVSVFHIFLLVLNRSSHGSGLEGTRALIRYVTSLVSSTERYHSVLRTEINQLQEKLLLLEDQLTEEDGVNARHDSAKDTDIVEDDGGTRRYTVEVTRAADSDSVTRYEQPVIAKTHPRHTPFSLKQGLTEGVADFRIEQLQFTHKSNVECSSATAIRPPMQLDEQ